MLEKILSIHRWNIAGALHNSKGMRLYASIPKGHVNVIFPDPQDLLIVIQFCIFYHIIPMHIANKNMIF